MTNLKEHGDPTGYAKGLESANFQLRLDNITAERDEFRQRAQQQADAMQAQINELQQQLQAHVAQANEQLNKMAGQIELLELMKAEAEPTKNGVEAETV